ncbi:hypothetical protein PI126_g11562 [Phytophthora idaei]|nr:hypothetical protein PI126_g11562 [Phytophthora idaei]
MEFHVMMLDRYFKLLEFVKDDADLEDALPMRTENSRLKALHAELTNIESVTKTLQSTKVSMADARLLFDGLITLRASFAKYLGERAEIVYAADFEAACVKIQDGQPVEADDGTMKKLRDDIATAMWVDYLVTLAGRYGEVVV